MATTKQPREWFVCGLLACVLVLGALLPAPAAACINATMASNEAITNLKRAEQALDEGDVLTARELASEVRIAMMHTAHGDARDMGLYERAARLQALSRIRDPRATPQELAAGAELLASTVAMIDATEGTRTLAQKPSPALLADHGEALERIGKDVEALARLVPLADADLVGSAYAYAALARAAKRSGDHERAATAMARCTTMAVDPKMCAGTYPRRPFLRGRPVDYALPAGGFLFAFVLSALWRRGRPWATYRDRPFAAAVAGVAALVFVVLPDLTRGLVLMTAGLALLAFWQRHAFFAAVRRGAVPGFRLRPTEPVDASAPILRLALLPSAAETLERQIDPGYRESARAPVLRLEGRPLRLVWVALVFALAVFGGCALLLRRGM